jgi:hypothetical protein
LTDIEKSPALTISYFRRPQAGLSFEALASFFTQKRGNAAALPAGPTLWPLAAILILAIAAQWRLGVNTDTSWNITLAEKLLAGQRPYIDFIEINPPASFLLCLVPTLLAQLTGASPEFMVDLFCFVSAALSLWIAGLILRHEAIAREAGARLAIVAALTLLLLPGRAFAQREHIAVLAALPCLASIAVWASGGRVAPALSLLAGVGAGLALAIKPHFALFFLPAAAFLGWRAGWRALFRHSELYAALVVAALCWAGIFLYFPAFFEHAAPIAQDIYLPVRRSLATTLTDPTLIIWAALLAALAYGARGRLKEPLAATFALASIGAIGAYLAQGKLWPYQGYPAIAFMALAFGALIADKRQGLRKPAPALAAIALIAAGGWLASGAEKPALERAVAAVAPHPKLIAIGADIAIGHPLTRRVHGVWVGSLSGLWITDMSSHALAQHPSAEAALRYESYLRFDREKLVADIAAGKPDAILVASKGWLAWAESHPDVAAALAAYHWRATADDVMVYARSDASAAPSQ